MLKQNGDIIWEINVLTKTLSIILNKMYPLKTMKSVHTDNTVVPKLYHGNIMVNYLQKKTHIWAAMNVIMWS